jgi:peptide/nickel transport system permease protein
VEHIHSPLVVALLSALIWVPLGIGAAFIGGWLDAILSRSFDVLFAFPALLLAAVIVATFGPGFTTIVMAVTVIYVPLMARVVRAATLVEKQKAYVDAMRVQGFGATRICALHIVQPPTPDWSSMLWYADQQVYISTTGVVFPAIAIVLAVVAFNLVGDWLSELS